MNTDEITAKAEAYKRLADQDVQKAHRLVPQGGDDRIYTPDALASAIVGHFRPTGRILEPCRGGGAFVRAMPGCDSFEIDAGTDFLTSTGRWDWILTNPPWSKFRAFLQHAMQVSDNIVFLSTTNHFLALRARRADTIGAGFGLVEVLELDTPPEPWPQSGFQLGAGWFRRGWTGSTHFSRLQ